MKSGFAAASKVPCERCRLGPEATMIDDAETGRFLSMSPHEEADALVLLHETRQEVAVLLTGQRHTESRLEELARRVEHGLGNVHRRLDDWSKHGEAAATLRAQHDALASRVSRIESTQTWVVRVVFGIIIAAVLGLVLIQRDIINV